jgi:hypothetical protein
MPLRWFRCHDIYEYTKFHKDWFSHSKVDKGTQTHRQHGDRISLLLFLQNKESRIKIKNTNKMKNSIGINMVFVGLKAEFRIIALLKTVLMAEEMCYQT